MRAASPSIVRLRRRFSELLGTRGRLSARGRLGLAAFIFILSFTVRSLYSEDLASVMYTAEQPFSGLAEGYDKRAVEIAKGEGLLGPYDVDPSETSRLSQAPGYPIFLSAIYGTAGRDFFKVQLVQNLFNSISPVLIFLIAGNSLSWRVGFASGLLTALSHHLGYMSNFILPDALCALPTLAAVYCLTLTRGKTRLWYITLSAAGLLVGLSSWLRPQSMLLGVFLSAVVAIISVRRAMMLKRLWLTAFLSILMIAPITIRNYIVYRAFLPINIGVGLNLWEGIADASGDRFGAVATDNEVAAQEAVLYDEPRYGGSMYTPDGIARDRDRTRKSLAIIVRHPVWYLGVMLGRMRDMLKYSAHASLLARSQNIGEHVEPIRKGWEGLAAGSVTPTQLSIPEWLRPPLRMLQRATKEPMLAFILFGIAVAAVAAPRKAAFLFTVPLYYLLFQSLVHTEFRYTLPMQYFLFVFAATAWVLIAMVLWQGVQRLASLLRARTNVI